MERNFNIEDKTVHLWRISIPELLPQLTEFLRLLNSDEVQRANRFRFPEHRQRFIIARGALREILHCYTAISPNEIQFTYGARGKPYLQNNSYNIQFNVSHSHDIAVYALTIKNEIGVDIEKIEEKYNDAVAKRFFSEHEYRELSQLTKAEQIIAFYKIWSFKEALIKAVGEGLYVPLNEFSVNLHDIIQMINFTHSGKTILYHLESLQVHPDYQAAFVTPHPVEHKCFWEWTLTGPQVWR